MSHEPFSFGSVVVDLLFDVLPIVCGVCVCLCVVMNYCVCYVPGITRNKFRKPKFAIWKVSKKDF